MPASNHLTSFSTATDPLSITQYQKLGGLDGLAKALKTKPEEVIKQVKEAKLRGRGGAGFDTGFKWSAIVEADEKYVVCNADEGEPGTFKDRFLMEKSPYLMLEGLIIAGYAIGASKGFIYIRGEYPRVTETLHEALDNLKSQGWLGDKIQNSDFSFDIEIKEGGGSYVVGDETALINSLMGNRGYPLLKPPYPTESGLWDKPTLVNNVETLSCVPLILSKGPKAFAKIGAPDCPGPKLYCVSGHVNKPGVYEFPMGVTLRELLEAAGGVRGTLKAVQIGGTAGPVYKEDALDFKLDFEAMRAIGGTLGSGAVIVMNTTVSMDHVLDVTLRFFAEESCGQCFPCRYGTRQLAYMSHNIASGNGKPEYIKLMRDTVNIMTASSFCAFGKSVTHPLSTLLDNFGDEISAIIKQQQFVKEVS